MRTAKTRPAVVVQANNLETGLNQVVIAMITSRMDRAGHRSRVVVLKNDPAGKQAGLLKDSIVMTDNLATVFWSAISRRIGTIAMVGIDDALRHTLDL